jgi:segregation and condensation protein A
MSALAIPNPQQVAAVFGVIEPPPLHIETETFSGPLTALFLMVRDHKVDLLGVPLGPICEMYLRYLMESEEPNLESHAVAVSALCWLLERKAWMLIPVEQEAEEPEACELPEEIEPYVQEFLPAIDTLMSKKNERDHLFFRTGEESSLYELPFESASISSSDLAKAFERVLARAKPDVPERLDRPRRSLSDQMVLVLRALRAEPASLEELIDVELTRTEVVWWFLALLELIRLGQASVFIHDGNVTFSQYRLVEGGG